MTPKALLFFALGLSPVATVLSQNPPTTKPSFEVAVVKQNASGENYILVQPGGRFVATGATLRRLMGTAYRIRDFQIIGGPSWMSSDRWDVQAKAEEGSIPPRTGPPDPNAFPPTMLMMQSLLEERFKLKIRQETREMPVYELVVASGGPKLKLSEDQNPFGQAPRGTPLAGPPPPGTPLPQGFMRNGRGSIQASGVPIESLILNLSNQLGRTVIDKTGLADYYDFTLEWTPDLGQGAAIPGAPDVPSPAPAAAELFGPSIFTALQEQLGLRLDSARGPVQVLVVENAEKPTEN